MNVGIRYRGGRWPGLKSTFLWHDEFFPVQSTLLEGIHPLQGPENLKHHTLIHNHSMAFDLAVSQQQITRARRNHIIERR
jgi:LysR family transcriptional regulator, glycine cleavage system transcriptional activator